VGGEDSACESERKGVDGEGGAGGSGRDMRAREGAREGLGVEGRGERRMVRRCVSCERGRER
jgi:hypothetical protein